MPTASRLSYCWDMDERSKFVYRQTAADFVIVELDLALTYCRLALSTNNPVSVSRNIENAKRALQAALSTERRLDVRPRDKGIIAEKSFRVESLLVELARRGTWIAG
ncbi:MAG TPA: hypothetical protein VHM93_08005 [Candidatus Acidoferrum sp.]|nr:hypothetical protein [Candidatus Acidoferrum sp.]